MKDKTYFCIDLKSFYASVECAERGLDTMTTNLVVADPDRSEKTICLAVSPSLRKQGIKNRCRVFEIPDSIDFIMAPPQMKKYIQYSADIYGLYLDYFNKDDIHVYSIDEVFIDVTSYLNLYHMTPKELAIFLIQQIDKNFSIKATCGIGTNLFLAKVALDITAKHSTDFIGELNEDSFKKRLWKHQPLTDFWRIGQGTQKKLQEVGIFTMEEITKADPELLYKLFGIDAELLIDHAHGIEPVTIKEIKKFKPKTTSFSSGQVLMRDYTFKETEIIIREMLYDLLLKYLQENLVSSNISIIIRYSKNAPKKYERFSVSFNHKTNQYNKVIDRIIDKFNKNIDKDFRIRKVTISINNLEKSQNNQLNFFDCIDNSSNDNLNDTVLDIKNKFGKNSILKGIDLLDSATSKQRHTQIGGHKSGS